ncbi:MAG: hypothetical protein MZV63_36555 [Marinilabiliales bacterium]|nr:hypothetical protein [Marinilabiliales bacterium]
MHYFVKPKDLKLIDPGIKTEITEKADVIEVQADLRQYLAKMYFFMLDGLEGQFSDNYFDVAARGKCSSYSPKVRINLTRKP